MFSIFSQSAEPVVAAAGEKERKVGVATEFLSWAGRGAAPIILPLVVRYPKVSFFFSF